MKNKITLFLRKQAEVNRQALVLGAVLFFTGLMSTGIVSMVRAATDNTNVSLNVAAGALSVTAPAQLNFNQGTSTPGGTAIMNTGTGNIIETNDPRGTGAGWTLSGYYNNIFENADKSVNLKINDTGSVLRALWKPNDMTIENNTGVSGDVQESVMNNFPNIGSGNKLPMAVAASGNGQGTFNYVNLQFNYNVSTEATPEDYTTEFIFELV
ncbi:TPA: hypothetical protein DHW58_00005 [Patescibacteria group bacterium]|uniref:WxL domain-containing protein n=2 Tax=Bacteria division Kazan-3B-28 TaxID=1798534 RepID=A0A0G1X6H4_UNCK3|nr:MAG: hypothetical protein VE98_C0001G0377 [candidate division Kazan bacterium GW2011_GWA1_50_15]KKW25931.1 MAG: hypothetical protein VE99_C0001G0572 [candidate division Kazan bacterium GW2011_GWC1_52_13]KKW26586.1 MAG: hypothetical protein VF00_C0003G0016 [candidate division Kazan bacterium GW2011_GWB1_52_7]HAV65684.1 hypothetical protein [Patescibacteria group bacterium]HCL47366.1 hypothetical protein [Patescibacteria group bacterium]